MKFHASTHRYVLEIGPFVVKVPRVRMSLYLEGGFRYWRKHAHSFNGFTGRCEVRLLLGGLLENFREAGYWLKSQHRLLAPCLIPLVLFNVYPKEEGAGRFLFDGDEVAINLIKFIKSEDRQRFWGVIEHLDGHSTGNKDNFAFDGRRIKVLDYGGPGMGTLIENFGDEFEQCLLSFAIKDPQPKV